jgi:hypothetical protein
MEAREAMADNQNDTNPTPNDEHESADRDLANLAYDLVEGSGEFLCHALRKEAWELDAPLEKIDWNYLDEHLSDARIEELESGKEASEEERSLLRQALIRQMLEEPDDDVTPGVWICEGPPDTDLSPVVVVICEGYSFTDMNRTIFDSYDDLDNALQDLRKYFYLSSDFE